MPYTAEQLRTLIEESKLGLRSAQRDLREADEFERSYHTTAAQAKAGLTRKREQIQDSKRRIKEAVVRRNRAKAKGDEEWVRKHQANIDAHRKQYAGWVKIYEDTIAGIRRNEKKEREWMAKRKGAQERVQSAEAKIAEYQRQLRTAKSHSSRTRKSVKVNREDALLNSQIQKLKRRIYEHETNVPYAVRQLETEVTYVQNAERERGRLGPSDARKLEHAKRRIPLLKQNIRQMHNHIRRLKAELLDLENQRKSQQRASKEVYRSSERESTGGYLQEGGNQRELMTGRIRHAAAQMRNIEREIAKNIQVLAKWDQKYIEGGPQKEVYRRNARKIRDYNNDLIVKRRKLYESIQRMKQARGG